MNRQSKGVSRHMVAVLPDGREVHADYVPAVVAAMVRMREALAAGRQPRAKDTRLVRLWMVQQDEKYGGAA